MDASEAKNLTDQVVSRKVKRFMKGFNRERVRATKRGERTIDYWFSFTSAETISQYNRHLKSLGYRTGIGDGGYRMLVGW